MKKRPSRDYDPELKLESVKRYVTSTDGDGGNSRRQPVSVARVKFLEREDEMIENVIGAHETKLFDALQRIDALERQLFEMSLRLRSIEKRTLTAADALFNLARSFKS